MAVACRWQGQRVAVHELPLCASFNRGAGDAYHMNGAAMHRAPWLNLSLQDPQPQWLQAGGRFETAAGAVAREPYGSTQRTSGAFEGGVSYACAVQLAAGMAWSEQLYACAAAAPDDTLHVTYACVVGGNSSPDCAVSVTLQSAANLKGGVSQVAPPVAAVLGPPGPHTCSHAVCTAAGELSAGELQARVHVEPRNVHEVRLEGCCQCAPACLPSCCVRLCCSACLTVSACSDCCPVWFGSAHM